MKRILPILLLGAFLLLLPLLGFWHRLSHGPPPASGTLRLAGLEEPVEVVRDSFGIPHVWAASEHDLSFVQGYLHATDRLWQMERFRRVAEGRLSEIFGEAALSMDRFLRTLGMARAARAELEVLEPATLRALEAYAKGVNAALEGWRGPLPPEFVLLRFRPEAWEPLHSLYLVKIMAWDLAEYATGLSHARARKALDDEGYELVRAAYPPWGTTILKEGEGDHPGAGSPPPRWAGRWGPGEEGQGLPGETPRASSPPPPPGNGEGGAPAAPGRGGSQAGGRTGTRATTTDARASPVEVPEALLAAAEPPGAVWALWEAVSPFRGSNSWVVGGDRSHSGKPLLANDMHLGLEQPAIWYLMGLHAPGLDVVGMTLPGTPGVVAGHSAAVAWGFTNAYVDDADFFLEQVNPQDTTLYLTPSGWVPFNLRVEEIRVRGREHPEILVVRETRHGPVITGVEARAGGQLMSLRWVGLDPAPTATALLAMNRARTAEEFVAALAGFRNPHQNVVFADTAGTFGYWMAGTVPLRAGGRPPLLPVPGWTGEWDWVGSLPFHEHPHVVNPGRGYVATANNRPTSDSVSWLISDGGWERPYRAQRIEELLEAAPHHDARSLLAIQMDVTSPFVARHAPRAAAHFRKAGLEAEAELLEGWEGSSALDSRPAALFWTWRALFLGHLRRWLYGAEGGYTPGVALERLLEAGHPAADSLGALAASEAARRVQGRAWGEVQVLSQDHPLRAVPVVGRLLGFGREGVPREGSPYTVNVSHAGGTGLPFRVTAGPSQRHVVDLADPDGSGGFVLPGGQSGYPRSPHADDQLALWRKGELIPLPLDRGRVEARAARRLRLIPK